MKFLWRAHAYTVTSSFLLSPPAGTAPLSTWRGNRHTNARSPIELKDPLHVLLWDWAVGWVCSRWSLDRDTRRLKNHKKTPKHSLFKQHQTSCQRLDAEALCSLFQGLAWPCHDNEKREPWSSLMICMSNWYFAGRRSVPAWNWGPWARGKCTVLHCILDTHQSHGSCEPMPM